MGTDTTERTIPCPCGAGSVVITTSTPDHPWISAYNVHHSVAILCQACSEQFMVDGMRIVRRADYIEQVEARGRARAAHDQFSTSAGVRDVKAAFGVHLGTLPSVAAVYRYLTAHGLESYAIGSFRKRWRGGPHWAEQNISSWNLPKVLTLLGREAGQFVADLQRLKELDAAIPNVPTVLKC